MICDFGGRPEIRAAGWLRVTTIGWFLGFLVMLALIFIGQAVGVAQSMIGVGMGGGLGYWQSRRLRGVLERPRRWALATAAGMGTPFVLWDVSPLFGLESWFSLPACVFAGGLVVALWQWRLLKPHSDRAIVWVAACTIGWALPALAIALSDAGWIGEPWDSLLGLVGMFFGGVLLGAVTGKPLAWVLAATPASHPTISGGVGNAACAIL